MKSVQNQLEELGLIPVIKIDTADDAVPLAKALIEGGLPAAEVTFRTAAAEQALKNITHAFPDILVGAGTVLTTEQAQRALDAGVKFIVAPGFNPKVVDFCQNKGITVMPGIATPSDLEAALEMGLSVLKFFPAESMGGLEYLKSMSAPYGGVKFIPTGGINAENLLAYLKFNKVLACGGSWMVKPELIAAKKFDHITALVKAALTAMLGFKVLGLRLKTGELKKASDVADVFRNAFNIPVTRSNDAISVSNLFTLLADAGRGAAGEGAAGEFVIGTHFLKRAIVFLERNGIKTQSQPENKSVLLDLEFNGLAVVLKEFDA